MSRNARYPQLLEVVRIAGLRSALLCGILVLAMVMTPARAADDTSQAQTQPGLYTAPRWALELKGGQYKPDLELYQTFYGDDKNSYWAIAGAYRFTNWLELGAELAYSNDEGMGALPVNGILGGKVDYTLMPLQIFLNVRYDASPDQLFVPYAGIGIVSAWYKQKIDQQPDREGRSDIGVSTRVGVQLQLTNLDPSVARNKSVSRSFKTYVFLEGQVFSTEVDGVDLGGEIYLLGLRFEYD